jgi:hypothetical protein
MERNGHGRMDGWITGRNGWMSEKIIAGRLED